MKLESHATPYGGTPQHRYATLHRALEQGLDSDEVLVELAKVCAHLGHRNEAVRCAERIRNAHARASVQHLLKCRFEGPAEGKRRARAAAVPGTAAVHTGGSAPRTRPQSPRAAPAASHAGPVAASEQKENENAPGVAEHLLDSVQYLLHQHMPWLVLTTTLAFPMVVGVGGFLTAGGSPLLLAAIAALPGLSVLAVVAAMGRQILLTSSDGVVDVPNLPEFSKLVRDARRFGCDALMVAALFFGPAVLLTALGAPLVIGGAAFFTGALLAPMAFALRQIRGDMRSLSPSILLRAVQRSGAGYIAIALIATASFAPAAVLGWATWGRPVWVQIALIGPLCVLPAFAASRLLGSWIDTRRQQLGYLLRNPQQTMLGTGDSPTAARDSNAQRASQQPRFPKKPAALERFRAPVVDNRTAAYSSRQSAGEAESSAQRPRRTRPAPRAIEGRRPQAAPAQRPARPAAGRQPQTRTQPQARPLQEPQPCTDQQPAPAVPAGLQDGPDLGNLPGAYVVSGEDRQRQGAASRRR